MDEDRLDSIAGPGVGVRYSYDADGRRIKEASGGQTKQYLIDGLLPYGQVIAETDGSNDLVVEYTYGQERISQERDGEIHWYLGDGQGSIRQLTDSNGVVSDAYDHVAFGELLASTGSTDNQFRYVGEQEDPSSGHYYLRARWMDPITGRFLSIDPAGKCPDCSKSSCSECSQDRGYPKLILGCSSRKKSLLSLKVVGGCSQCFRIPQEYNYADNSPVSKIDPTGYMAWTLRDLSIGLIGSALIAYTYLTIVKTSPVYPTLRRVRDGGCRCSFRLVSDPDLIAQCPERVYGRGKTLGECQNNAKLTAPNQCRAFYGHCGWVF